MVMLEFNKVTNLDQWDFKLLRPIMNDKATLGELNTTISFADLVMLDEIMDLQDDLAAEREARRSQE